MKVPKVNEVYNYFDDGKIRESRLEQVEIKEIIPFSEIDKEILKLWKRELKQCHWLYNLTTDYFIKSFLKETKVIIYFVRCKKNGWFSLGWYGGRLDIDGELYKQLEQNN